MARTVGQWTLAGALALMAAGPVSGQPTPALPTAPARLGPTAMFLQTVCIPWLGGVDANALAAAAQKRGLRPLWAVGKLGGIQGPDALISAGWGGAHLDEQRKWCEVHGSYRTGSRVARIAADVDAMAARTVPAWHFVKAVPRKDQYGNLPQYAWETPTHTLTLHEEPDPWSDPVPGQPDALGFGLHLQKK